MILVCQERDKFYTKNYTKYFVFAGIKFLALVPPPVFQDFTHIYTHTYV